MYLEKSTNNSESEQTLMNNNNNIQIRNQKLILRETINVNTSDYISYTNEKLLTKQNHLTPTSLNLNTPTYRIPFGLNLTNPVNLPFKTATSSTVLPPNTVSSAATTTTTANGNIGKLLFEI